MIIIHLFYPQHYSVLCLFFGQVLMTVSFFRNPQLSFRSSKDLSRPAPIDVTDGRGAGKQVLISYVRSEAAEHALRLKEALVKQGITVYLVKSYREIIFIPWTFNFVYSMGRNVHKFKILIKYYFGVISYIFESLNSSVHEHVHGLQTTKFGV